MRGARLAPAMIAVAVVTAAWCALATDVRATYGAQTTADEPQYLLTALSLAEDLDLDIADERAAGAYRDWHELDLPEQDALQDDGTRISPHDPLLPALLAVPVALGGWAGAKLALAGLAGLLAAAVLWVAVRRFDVPVGVAAVTALAAGAGPPLALYGTQVYPELAAALAVTVAVGAVTGPPSARGAAVTGLAVVALPWLSVKYAPVAAVLAGLALARLARDHRRLAVGLAAGLAVAGVVHVAFHLAVYGGVTPYAAGSHFTAGELTVVGNDPNYPGRARRLVGLLVDRDFGLAVWHPLWWLAVPAVGAVARRRPPGWAVLLLPLAAGWLNATFVALTMHGWWWPGRQVVVVLPCAVLALAWWAARAPAVRPWVAVTGLAGAATYLWLVVEGLGRRLTLVVDPFTTTNPLVRVVRLVLPSGRRAAAGDEALLAAWAVVAAGLAVVGWRWAGSAGSAERHEDAAAGEGADAHVTVVDVDGDRAVR